MKETTNVQQAQSAGQSTVWNALIAVAIGALLAVLVCVPYDQVFGLSTGLCAGLRYTASVAVFATGLSSGRLTERPFVCQTEAAALAVRHGLVT
jgi:hypothetical protein